MATGHHGVWLLQRRTLTLSMVSRFGRILVPLWSMENSRGRSREKESKRGVMRGRERRNIRYHIAMSFRQWRHKRLWDLEKLWNLPWPWDWKRIFPDLGTERTLGKKKGRETEGEGITRTITLSICDIINDLETSENIGICLECGTWKNLREKRASLHSGITLSHHVGSNLISLQQH